MYLPIPPQPDCASAWLEAVRKVDAQPGHEAHNVVIDVTDPTAGATLATPIVARVNDFLVPQDKSVEAIANTIFPQALYLRYGMPDFIDVFHKRVLPKVRSNTRWSGYYFERMTSMPVTGGGKPLDQLSRMIERIQDKNNTSLNKYELSLFDPERDVTGSPYGGQCLSFLSFHLQPMTPKTLLLTAQYRNHYYVEKLVIRGGRDRDKSRRADCDLNARANRSAEGEPAASHDAHSRVRPTCAGHAIGGLARFKGKVGIEFGLRFDAIQVIERGDEFTLATIAGVANGRGGNVEIP